MQLGINPKRGKRIIALAAPILVAMISQTFINVIDTIYVGKLDPTYSIPGQAALGFSLPIYWSIGGFLSALGIGTQAMTARRFGANEHEGAGRILANSLSVAFFASITLTIVGWFLIPYIFPFLTADTAVQAIGIPYTRIRILAILPMVGTMAFKGFFDGLGRTRIHMYACLIMNGVNVVLNYVFIFGVGPIPAFYVEGAAVASFLSTFIGLALMIAWSFYPEFIKKYRFYRVKNLRPSVMWEIIKLSVPSGAAEIFMMSGVLLFLKIVAMLDEQAVTGAMEATNAYGAALGSVAGEHYAGLQDMMATATGWTGRSAATEWGPTILQSRPSIYTTAAKLIIDLMTIGFVACIAFGQATSTLVSQHMGKGLYDEAERYGWDSVKIGMYFFGFVGMLVIFYPEAFLDFLSDDPLVIEAAVPGLRVFASLEMFTAMSLILIQAFFGAGNTKLVMYVEFILHGLCLVPLAYLLAIPMGFGFMGVWMSAAVYIVALAIVLAWKFWEGNWKEIEV